MADRLFLEFHTTGGHVLDLVPADELLEAAKQYVLKRLDLNTLNADDFVVTVDGKISSVLTYHPFKDIGGPQGSNNVGSNWAE
jgi:hypothetical protein